MAAGVTDHAWTVAELLRYRIEPFFKPHDSAPRCPVVLSRGASTRGIPAPERLCSPSIQVQNLSLTQ